MSDAPYETVVLVTCAPYQGRKSEEVLEAIMSLALFDRSHAVVFWDQGLEWLVDGQSPAQGKNLSRQLAALPLYGSEALFYCEEHREAGWQAQPGSDVATPLTVQAIAQTLRQARYIEVF